MTQDLLKVVFGLSFLFIYLLTLAFLYVLVSPGVLIDYSKDVRFRDRLMIVGVVNRIKIREHIIPALLLTVTVFFILNLGGGTVLLGARKAGLDF